MVYNCLLSCLNLHECEQGIHSAFFQNNNIYINRFSDAIEITYGTTPAKYVTPRSGSGIQKFTRVYLATTSSILAVKNAQVN